MSKYTRSNKINHYHDSSISSLKQKKANNNNKKANFTRIASSIIIDNNSIENCSHSNFSSSVKGKCHLDQLVGDQLEPDLVGQSKRATVRAMVGPSRSKQNNISRRNFNSRDSSTLKQLAFFAFFILATIIVCSEVRGVSSLNCYHCSSVDDPGCDEAFSGRANFTDTDCYKHIGRPAKVCRKIVQYIEDKKVVLRSCGYIDEHEGKDQKAMCYKRSGTFAIMMESCNCYEDNCNHSASLVPSKSLLLGLSSSAGLLILLAACLSQQVINIRPSSVAAI